MRLPFLAKAGLVIISLVLIWRQLAAVTQLIRGWPLNDFSVYMNGVEHTLTGNPYTQKFFDYYNYPPPATLFFYAFKLLPVDASEFVFTGLSITSLFISTLLLFRLTHQKPKFYLLLPISYLLLRFNPTRLTLTLGQINLIVLLLILLAFYFSKKRQFISGITLALAFIFKFTPIFLLLFFILKKQGKVILGFIDTVILLHFLAILAFGWNLTGYYYLEVLPKLLTQTGLYTAQLTYMNQSLTALLGRLGIFDLYHTLIKLAAILPLLWLLSRRRLDFTTYALFLMFMTIFLPTFAWQHHYVFLIPAIFLLGIRHWALGISAYLLLTITIGLTFPVYANPFIHSHLFLSAAAIFALIFVARPQSFPGRKSIQRKPAD